MPDVQKRIQEDDLFFDSGVVAHGFTPYMRDYDIVIERSAAKPNGSGSYIEGRYRYRFTHCVEAHARTRMSLRSWRSSWADDRFIDYARWEQAGAPEGLVWGVCWQEAYPGISYLRDSPRAEEWGWMLEWQMHEIRVETNFLRLELVFHDFSVDRLATGDPVTGELTEHPGES